MTRLLLASLLLSLACGDDSSGTDTGPSPDVPIVDVGPMDANVPGRTWEISAPTSVPAMLQHPVVIHAMADGALDTSSSGDFEVEVSNADSTVVHQVRMRRGIGSLTIQKGVGETVVEIGGTAHTMDALDMAPTVVSGELTRLTWSGVIQVDANVTVPAGETLVIEPGTVVMTALDRSILVDGAIEVAPGGPMTLFTSIETDEPWGGVVINGGTAAFNNTAFVGGGGNEGRAFGHSGSQPVIFGESANVTLRDIVIQDGPGKALGGRQGEWSIESSLFTRLDTGGEFDRVALSITGSQWMDFPTIDAPVVDDDNDGIYLLGNSSAEQPLITITNSTWIGGADDGIDHNGSRVQITGSYIEGFANECIATSSGGTVELSDTLLSGCGQGLEAGYGGPTVTGEHLLIQNNGTGVRIGDSYSDRPEYTGTITLTDSIIQGNGDFALRNFVLTDMAPRPGALSVSTSVVDRDEVEVGDENIIDTAVLTDELLMAPGSPGEGIAGGNPGLITPR
ncbi:MAG: right-handed parallel beta-helix repeat-containing protein [Polyangiales bacterium]